MPESIPSSPDARCSALQDFFRDKEAESFKNRCQSHRRMTPSIHAKLAVSHGNGRNNRPQRRGAARSTNPSRQGTVNETAVPGSGRKPGTSQYYGVRFRPDLNKWVAEIRVAEWKAVDKKVWLGTFETEQAAARGVDLARKLLKCTKKHPPNLPCDKLAAYSTQIPPHLILTDLTATSMFRSATLFIKHECKEYAASFDDSPADSSIVDPESSNGVPFFNQASEFHSADSSGDSDFSEMILEMTIDDGLHQVLEVDSYEVATNYCGNYEVGLSSSPTGSCNSTVTLEALQVPETWEISDCQDVCCTASSSSSSAAVMPEMIEGLQSMMDTDVSAGSHQYAHDACFWPELQDPFFLSDSVYGSTSFGNYVTPMDSDPWFSLPGALQYPHGWH